MVFGKKDKPHTVKCSECGKNILPENIENIVASQGKILLIVCPSVQNYHANIKHREYHIQW